MSDAKTGELVTVQWGTRRVKARVIRKGYSPRTGKYVTVRFDLNDDVIETDYLLDEVRPA